MKYLLAALLCLPFFAGAQTRGTYEPPVFGKDSNAINSFLSKNIKYPEEALDRNIEGFVLVRFRVDSLGNVDSVSIPFSFSPILSEEAARVVKLSTGKWQPLKINGVATSSWMYLPVKFMFEDGMGISGMKKIEKAQGYLFYKQGLDLYNEGKEEEARSAFMAAYILDKENIPALLNLALISINSGEYPAACYRLKEIKSKGKNVSEDMMKEVDNMLSTYCKD